MWFKGAKCPLCEQVFDEKSDVVVCPVCGTPHHRDCWKTENRCANESLHDSGFVWTDSENRDNIKPDENSAQNFENDPENNGAQTENDPNSEKTQEHDEEITCPGCGHKCSPEALNCPECGAMLGFGAAGRGSQTFTAPGINYDTFLFGVGENPNEDIGGATVLETAVFTRTNARKYVSKFKKMNQGKKKLSWNWAAFIFTPYWFFFRKLYKAGAVFLGLIMAAELALSVPMDKAYDAVDAIVAENYGISTDALAEDFDSGKYYLAFAETLTQGITNGAASQKALSNGQIGAVRSFLYTNLLYYGIILLLSVAAALLADMLYKKKLVNTVSSLKENQTDEKMYKALLFSKGGTSLVGVCISYMAPTVIMWLLEAAFSAF